MNTRRLTEAILTPVAAKRIMPYRPYLLHGDKVKIGLFWTPLAFSRPLSLKAAALAGLGGFGLGPGLYM